MKIPEINVENICVYFIPLSSFNYVPALVEKFQIRLRRAYSGWETSLQLPYGGINPWHHPNDQTCC